MQLDGEEGEENCEASDTVNHHITGEHSPLERERYSSVSTSTPRSKFVPASWWTDTATLYQACKNHVTYSQEIFLHNPKELSYKFYCKDRAYILT